MKLLYELQDDQYPYEYIDHTRPCARGVIVNEKGEIALNKLNFTDIFGLRDYYELPGGGVNMGEDTRDAFLRESEEEVGYRVAILDEIGEVSDYYNLIHRHNRNYYFLARAETYVGQRLEDKEIKFIEKLVWLPIEDAIARYEAMSDTMISGLVKRRELPILHLARELLKKI
jgi:8-oxo-dGTP pyrophosphatase MutT (NUDIX family)